MTADLSPVVGMNSRICIATCKSFSNRPDTESPEFSLHVRGSWRCIVNQSPPAEIWLAYLASWFEREDDFADMDASAGNVGSQLLVHTGEISADLVSTRGR